MARGNARRMAAERLLAQAHQGVHLDLDCSNVSHATADFQAVTSLDPTNREAQAQLRRNTAVSLA